MANVEDWIRVYASTKRKIKIRAANVLLDRAAFVPLDVLIEILETFSSEGLGARAEKALLGCRDAEIIPKSISLLESKDPFVRQVACTVLGHSGDRTATPHLLRILDDPDTMVRRSAGFALSFLKDPSSLTELKLQFDRHQNDDSNLVMAIQCALRNLGANVDE